MSDFVKVTWISRIVSEAEEGTPPHQKLFQNRKYFSDHSYDLFTSFFKVVLRIEPDPTINFFWGSRCYRAQETPVFEKQMQILPMCGFGDGGML